MSRKLYLALMHFSKLFLIPEGPLLNWKCFHQERSIVFRENSLELDFLTQCRNKHELSLGGLRRTVDGFVSRGSFLVLYALEICLGTLNVLDGITEMWVVVDWRPFHPAQYVEIANDSLDLFLLVLRLIP